MRNDQLRLLAVFVDEPDPGEFYYVLHESTAGAADWFDVLFSERSYTSWMAAFDAGSSTLMSMVADKEFGPRARRDEQNGSSAGRTRQHYFKIKVSDA